MNSENSLDKTLKGLPSAEVAAPVELADKQWSCLPGKQDRV